MSIKGVMSMDHERVSFNIARLRKGGQHFEVAVDPDIAVAFKSGKPIDIKDVIKSEKIFSDVKKGTLAPEHILKQLFGTDDADEVAKVILREGEIQLSEEYRTKLREDKKKKIVSFISKNAVDPRSKLPHPPQRIENAMEQAKVKIDYFKSAEEQIDGIVAQLRPIIPISFERTKVEVKIPPEHSGKAYGLVSQFGKPEKEEWLNDGSFYCIVEIPAALEPDLYEKANAMTKGAAQIKPLGAKK